LPFLTGDDPRIFGTVHVLFERFAEDDTGFVLVEVAHDDSYAVLLHATDTKKEIAGDRNCRRAADNYYLRASIPRIANTGAPLV